jgi:flagellar basal body-associated protein FliL
MEVQKKSKGLWWIIFFISTALFAFAIYVHWPWLMFLLPFVCTSLVKALDII